uniref:ATP-dependent DNA helicase n=1 Tax=Globodera rostochiensis TaxID=31243 RepID=A0A914I8I8_GLORO
MVTKERKQREAKRVQKEKCRKQSNASLTTEGRPSTHAIHQPSTETGTLLFHAGTSRQNDDCGDVVESAVTFAGVDQCARRSICGDNDSGDESIIEALSVASVGESERLDRGVSLASKKMARNTSISSGDVTLRCRSARLVKLQERHVHQIEETMKKVLNDYINRPWPTEARQKKQKRRSSDTPNCTRCGDECDCTSYAQCQQNAAAFLAAGKYAKEYNPATESAPKFEEIARAKGGRVTQRCHQNKDLKCASKSASHRVDYYDSGQFGEAVCEHCGALMLKGENEKIKGGRLSQCCAGGDVHTQQMKAEFEELQTPPAEYSKGLINSNDQKTREAFLDNTMPFNNTFAFASVRGEKAPEDQMGGRLDTCKYNGEFCFQFSDLIAPGGRRPTFAQVYTLTPEAAMNIRDENLTTALSAPVKAEIVRKLEELMRANPFGRTFETAGAKIEAAKSATGEIPRFQIALLTDRDLKTDALKNRGDVTIIERADAPTAKQVAVIWVQEDGLAPEISAFWVCDKAGKMRELESGMPQLDPCCFPLLHPRGTPGWRWFIKKRGRMVNLFTPTVHTANKQLTREEREEVQMQDALDNSMAEEVAEPMPNEPDAGASDHREDDEMPEEALELDEEVPEEEENTAGREADAVMEPEIDGSTKKSNISERQFYRYRMALRGDDKSAFHWLWFARRLAEYFTISVLNRIERNDMDHLKAIQTKKNYRQILARDYIAAMEKGLQKWGRNAKLGRVFLMPQSFAGSRQYYQGKYADLMTMVRHLGAPTWFVTFTGNPKWPEIAEALRRRQNYAHRPDIVCRIFMDKATEFIKDLTERHVLGKVAGWCYSVEHQKRGMPHIHMLLILDKGGRIISPEQVDEYVSARIPTLPPIDDHSPEANQQRRLWHNVTTMMLHDCNAACLEGSNCRKHFPKPYSDRTELSEVRYTNYVRLPPEDSDQWVAPTCGDARVPSGEDHLPADDPERDWAEVRYQRIPHKGRNPQRQHEECGRTFYKQRKGGRSALLLDDSRVIPYNNFLLLKYGTHINIEYVFGQKACKYIFKYLLKGFEKAYVQVTQPRKSARRQSGDATEDVYDYDEIAATFKVRYMTAMEAYLRLHSYKIVGTSHQIYTLSVHDEGGHTIVVEEGQEQEGHWKVDANTRLTAFFKLCGDDPTAALLTYDRVPYQYSWNYKAREWKKRGRPLSEDIEKARMFVRVYTVSPRKHELFAIRLLLLHRPGPKSFEDLRTIDGVVFSTFAGAAQHLGLLESDLIFRRSMREACAEKSNFKQLQHYFAMLLCHARPAEPQELFDEFLDEMNPPFAANNPAIRPKSVAFRGAEVMRNLEYFFNCMGTTSGDVGLSGLPNDYNFDRQAGALQQATLLDEFYGDQQGRAKSPQQIAIEKIGLLNKDQRNAFNDISSAIRSADGQRLFFLEGSGGCGKTFLYNTLIKWCLAGKPTFNSTTNQERGRENPLCTSSVIAAASTGIAALLLIGGGTAHRQFSVPNDVTDDTAPTISFESSKGEQLRGADLIIIDEISMLSSRVLKYIDRLLRDVCAVNDKPFGGKVVVCGGDWKQLTPVVEHGTREDQVAESIKTFPLFKTFQKISLTINMRTAPGEQALRDWLHNIGNGLHQVGTDIGSRQPNLLRIPPQNVAHQMDDVINFCFPEALFSEPLSNADAIASNAVLCPTNNDVQHINDLALDRMSGDAKEYLSIDEPLEPSDEFNTFRADFNMEAVHSEMPSGMPPHKLILKVGTPVMLIRNLDVSQGLCNGTRLQVMRGADDNLFCRILTGPRADAKQTIVIPRVKFEYGNNRNHRGLRFRRLQFPVRLCFAMTVNKAQGQTLQRMALVLRGKQCFAHGQVYVAMSRVTRMDAIRVYAPSCQSGDDTRIANVVYHELLDDINVPPRPQHSELAVAVHDQGVGTLNADEDMESLDEEYFD